MDQPFHPVAQLVREVRGLDDRVNGPQDFGRDRRGVVLPIRLVAEIAEQVCEFVFWKSEVFKRVPDVLILHEIAVIDRDVIGNVGKGGRITSAECRQFLNIDQPFVIDL